MYNDDSYATLTNLCNAYALIYGIKGTKDGSEGDRLKYLQSVNALLDNILMESQIIGRNQKELLKPPVKNGGLKGV